jgi:hypothetical protein
LLAAFLVLALLWYTYPWFHVSDEILSVPSGTQLPPETVAKVERAYFAVNLQNSLYSLGLLGLVTSAILASVEGAARRSVLRALIGAAVGAVCGVLFGMLAGLVGFVFHRSIAAGAESSLEHGVMVQAATFALIGLAVGLGLGLTSGKLSTAAKCVLGGLFGGIFAGIVYPAITAFVMPSTNTELLVPSDPAARILWLAMSVGLITVAATGVGKGRSLRNAATPSRPQVD